jgi:hypothetical protein
MNEYIKHGVNGYLYDPRRPAPIDLSAAREVGRRARADAIAGHRSWQASRSRLLAAALAPFPAAAAPDAATTAAAHLLAGVERLKGLVPSKQRAMIASSLRARRP